VFFAFVPGLPAVVRLASDFSRPIGPLSRRDIGPADTRPDCGAQGRVDIRNIGGGVQPTLLGGAM
jgi:hypothetical protein